LTGFVTSAAPRLLISQVGRWRLLDALRCAAFVATFLLAWISLQPFADLGELDLRNLTTGNETLTYAAFGCMALLTAALTLRGNLPGMRSLLVPSLVLFAAWTVLSVLLSLDVGTSIRRFTLTACVISTAATMMLLPKSETELVRWLAIVTLTTLLTCYLGLLLAPHFSIHQATDVQEPHLAGDWRGVFGHKNAAAAMMAMISFIGLYIARRGALVSGCAVTGLATLFLYFSGGKSSLALWVMVLAISAFVAAIRSPAMKAVACFTPLIMMNLLSVGTVVSDKLSDIADLLPLDTTFTGRTDIWTFALSALSERLVTGYGFAAFWGSKSIKNLPEGMEWAATASHSHNGYLDTALAMGVPGLLLLIAVLVIVPLRNFEAAQRNGNRGPLVTMLFQIWLFGIYLSSMESFFLDRADSIWFTFLVAVFGLHYLARFPIQDANAMPPPA
jgi:O-antigen ligase